MKISDYNIPVKIIFGTGFGILFSAILISIMAAILSIGNIPSIVLHPMTVFVYIIGSFFGGFCSAKFLNKNGLICGLISGFIYFIILLIFGSIAKSWDFNLMSIIKFILIISAGIFGGIVGVN